MNEKLDEIDNESKANAGHVDNLREVNKELLERIKVNVQDDIDKQTGKGCLSLFNYFIDINPTLMSPFFVEKTWF